MHTQNFRNHPASAPVTVTEKTIPDEEAEPPSLLSAPPTDKRAQTINDTKISKENGQVKANMACVADVVFSRRPTSGIGKIFAPLFNLFNFDFSKDSQQQRFNKLLQEREEELNPIGGDESEMIMNIIKAGNLCADDVMVPRADMVIIDANLNLNDALVQMQKTPHTRYGVYGEDMDDIIGMIHIKDVLKSLAKQQNSKGKTCTKAPLLKKIMRPVLFVSPSMRILDLLLRMRVEGVHLAIVVDEYGGVDGQISLEGLVEEIIGEIREEYTNVSEPTLEKRGELIYHIDARYSLDNLQETIGDFLSDEERQEDIDTIGGFVTALAGRVPLQGEVIKHEESQFEFHILKADPRKIHKIRLDINPKHTLPS